MEPDLRRSYLALWLDLIRADRPAGWLLLLWTTLAALWIAAGLNAFGMVEKWYY